MVPELMEVPPQVIRCSGIPCLHLHSLVTMRRHPGIEDKISGTPTDLMVNTMPHSTLERLNTVEHCERGRPWDELLVEKVTVSPPTVCLIFPS